MNASATVLRRVVDRLVAPAAAVLILAVPAVVPSAALAASSGVWGTITSAPQVLLDPRLPQGDYGTNANVAVAPMGLRLNPGWQVTDCQTMLFAPVALNQDPNMMKRNPIRSSLNDQRALPFGNGLDWIGLRTLRTVPRYLTNHYLMALVSCSMSGPNGATDNTLSFSSVAGPLVAETAYIPGKPSVQLDSRQGNKLRLGDTFTVKAPMSFANPIFAADERMTSRRLAGAYVDRQGQECGVPYFTQVRDLATSGRELEARFTIPPNETLVGKYFCVIQSVITDAGRASSSAAYVLIHGRQGSPDPTPAADQPADPSANADPGQPVDPAPSNTPQEQVPAAESPQQPDASSAQSPAASTTPESITTVDSSLTELARAAGVDTSISPIVNTSGNGTRDSQTLRLTIPAVQKKKKSIPLAAVLTPGQPGSVTFTLTRLTPSGAWVVGKVKTGRLNAQGKVKTQWILDPKKPSGAYTVVATFTPKAAGVPGLTVTQPVTVR